VWTGERGKDEKKRKQKGGSKELSRLRVVEGGNKVIEKREGRYLYFAAVSPRSRDVQKRNSQQGKKRKAEGAVLAENGSRSLEQDGVDHRAGRRNFGGKVLRPRCRR